MIVLSPIAGVWAGKDGGRRPTLVGMTSLVLGLLVIIFGVGRPMYIIVIGLLLVSGATGLSLSPTTNVAMASIPPDRAGMASGIMSAQRALGSTAGFAIMGSVLAAVVGSVLPAKFEPFLPEPARGTIRNAARGISHRADPARSRLWKTSAVLLQVASPPDTVTAPSCNA